MSTSGHVSVNQLLQTGHAVVRVLAAAEDEADAYPALLAAIGESLGCDGGAMWLDERPVHLWRAAPDTPDTGLRVVVRDIGVMNFAAAIEPDDQLDGLLESLGLLIAHFAERCRAQQAVRASDARKSAILNAAFDCIITMDHEGLVVEVNRATETTFGYRAEEMVGRELAELIVPPEWRQAHRHGVERFVRTGHSDVQGHPLETEGMRADGTVFPIELIVTRPELPGPPLFCGYLRDMTEPRERERALRHLAAEQAALRRVATAVATESDPRDAFAVVTEEVGRLLGAPSANMIRFNPDETATVIARWQDTDMPVHELGATVSLAGDSVSARVFRTSAPARVDSYEQLEGELAANVRELGHQSAVAGPIFQEGGLWGAVIVAGGAGRPFPPGAEQRIANFAELAGQALANARAREDLAASRARIVQAGDAERRRLERNLHDGAQQRLVSLALMLRLAARRHPEDEALEQAGEELSYALQELREIARGIHPAVLTERGLEPAVRAVADRAPVPVELNVDLTERLPDPVEAAAYYVVAEALTNVAKYACATEVTVGVQRSNRHARIEVRDDGVGGAVPGAGTGLRGLADRVEALGGRLVIESPVGEGTTLRAEIPVAAG